MLAEIALVHLAAMASPGPNVLIVMHTAVAGSRAAGLWAGVGVATGALVWSASVALGLALLLDDAPVAAEALRVLGGCYLVFLGVRMVVAAGQAAAVQSQPVAPRSSTAWLRGTLTNLSNPKAAVFYLSIFATMLPADASPALRGAAVAVIGANSLAWHCLLAAASSTTRARGAYFRSSLWIDRVAGVVMASFGVLFAMGLR